MRVSGSGSGSGSVGCWICCGSRERDRDRLREQLTERLGERDLLMLRLRERAVLPAGDLPASAVAPCASSSSLMSSASPKMSDAAGAFLGCG